jgi:ABC-2 type transport system ATP-binding protein
MHPLIKVQNVSKTYYSGFIRKRGADVLKDIDLRVDEGEIFSLLGPNGAGKTTLMKIILGITYPTKGSVTLFGEGTRKGRIGYLPEHHQYPEKMKAGEIVKVFGLMRGMSGRRLDERVNELLSILDLKDRSKPLHKFSKGMRQRLGLAVALVDSPALLLLDEPTDGLDPVGRVQVRELLIDLKNRGTTVFINSHLLSEVEVISDRVAILDKGKLVTTGPVKNLTSREGYEIIIAAANGRAIGGSLDGYQVVEEGNEWKIIVSSKEEMNTLLSFLGNNDITVDEVRKKKTTLENYFISIIDRETK